MLEQSVLYSDRLTEKCLIDGRMTHAAFVTDHFAVRTEMLSIVAAEAAFGIEMPDVVSM